jgi:hypothetical protein
MPLAASPKIVTWTRLTAKCSYLLAHLFERGDLIEAPRFARPSPK